MGDEVIPHFDHTAAVMLNMTMPASHIKGNFISL